MPSGVPESLAKTSARLWTNERLAHSLRDTRVAARHSGRHTPGFVEPVWSANAGTEDATKTQPATGILHAIGSGDDVGEEMVRRGFGMVRSGLVRSCGLLSLLCVGACVSGPERSGPLDAGGSGGEPNISGAGGANTEQGGTGGSGTPNIPDYCYSIAPQYYCSSSGCPPFKDYVQQLLEDPPRELLVLPCGGTSDAGLRSDAPIVNDAGTARDAGIASDAGPSRGRYALVIVTLDDATTKQVYFDTQSGEVVAAARNDYFFASCPPNYFAGLVPAECAAVSTEGCPPRDAGTDSSISSYSCVLVR